MSGTCSTHGKGETCIWSLIRQNWREDTAWETCAGLDWSGSE